MAKSTLTNNLLSMNCPYCSADMILGKASVRGSFIGFLIIGLSHQHLWFNKKKIIKSGGSRPAYECQNCELILIPKDSRTWLDKFAGEDLSKMKQTKMQNKAE